MTLFETQRTHVRPFHKNDLTALSEMMADPLVMKFTGFRKPQNKAKVEELLGKWISDGKKPFGIWAVEETSSKDFLGWFMLKPTVSDDPELGFMIPKNKWNKGYATEVANDFLRYAFKTLKQKRVIASVTPENTASINILTKIGMVKIAKPLSDKGVLYFEAFN